MTAGWYVDPFSRFDGRYFDGKNWTDRVSHQGAMALDGGWEDFIASYKASEQASQTTEPKKPEHSESVAAAAKTEATSTAQSAKGEVVDQSKIDTVEMPDRSKLADQQDAATVTIDKEKLAAFAALDAKAQQDQLASEELATPEIPDLDDQDQSAISPDLSSLADGPLALESGASETEVGSDEIGHTYDTDSADDDDDDDDETGGAIQRSTVRMAIILAVLALLAVIAAWVLMGLLGSSDEEASDTQTVAEVEESKDAAGKDTTAADNSNKGDEAATETSSTEKEQEAAVLSAEKVLARKGQDPVKLSEQDAVKEVGEYTIFNGEQLLVDLEAWSLNSSEIPPTDDSWGCWFEEKKIDLVYCGPFRSQDGRDVVDVVPINMNEQDGGVSLQSNTGAALRNTQQFPTGLFIGRGDSELTVNEDGSRIHFQILDEAPTETKESDSTEPKETDSQESDTRGSRGSRGSRDKDD